MQTVTALGLGTDGEDHSNAEAVPCTKLCRAEGEWGRTESTEGWEGQNRPDC